MGSSLRMLALGAALIGASASLVHAADGGIDGAAVATRAAIRIDPPDPPPPSVDPLVARTVELVNAERAARGLSALTLHPQVAASAAAHAADMAATRRMSHTGSDGSSAGDRLTRAGYRWGSWGENVAAGYTTADSVVAGWMGSSGHRDNLLGNFRDVGVGVVAATDGTPYWALVVAS